MQFISLTKSTEAGIPGCLSMISLSLDILYSMHVIININALNTAIIITICAVSVRCSIDHGYFKFHSTAGFLYLLKIPFKFTVYMVRLYLLFFLGNLIAMTSKWHELRRLARCHCYTIAYSIFNSTDIFNSILYFDRCTSITYPTGFMFRV